MERQNANKNQLVIILLGTIIALLVGIIVFLFINMKACRNDKPSNNSSNNTVNNNTENNEINNVQKPVIEEKKEVIDPSEFPKYLNYVNNKTSSCLKQDFVTKNANLVTLNDYIVSISIKNLDEKNMINVNVKNVPSTIKTDNSITTTKGYSYNQVLTKARELFGKNIQIEKKSAGFNYYVEDSYAFVDEAALGKGRGCTESEIKFINKIEKTDKDLTIYMTYALRSAAGLTDKNNKDIMFKSQVTTQNKNVEIIPDNTNLENYVKQNKDKFNEHILKFELEDTKYVLKSFEIR